MSTVMESVPESADIDDAALERCIVELLSRRAADASICPSEAARSLEPDDAAWPSLMPEVRHAAARLALAGVIRVTQRGAEVDLETDVHGPVRLRRGPLFDQEA